MIKHDKIQHGKIQVGDTILDAEIDIETKASEEPIGQWFTGMRDYLTKYPTWPIVVDGSITEPITDEGRLLK